MNHKAFLLAFLCFVAVAVVIVAPLQHNAFSQTFTMKYNSVTNYDAFVLGYHPLGDPIDTPVPK